MEKRRRREGRRGCDSVRASCCNLSPMAGHMFKTFPVGAIGKQAEEGEVGLVLSLFVTEVYHH